MDLPFVEQGHGQDAVGVAPDALGLILVAAPQHGVGVEEDLVYAGVVHLADEAVRREFQIAEVGWVEVLGVGLAAVVPQDAARGAINAKVQIGQVSEVSSRGIEHVGGAGNAVTQAKGGLVVTGLRLLHGEQVLP